jgi:prefoldin subunit 5
MNNDMCWCHLHTGGPRWHWLYRDVQQRRANLTTLREYVEALETLRSILHAILETLRLAEQQHFMMQEYPIARSTAERVFSLRLSLNTTQWRYMHEEARRQEVLHEQMHYGDGRGVDPGTLTPEYVHTTLGVELAPINEERENLHERLTLAAEEIARISREAGPLQQQLERAWSNPEQRPLF